jgi:hypothetical protein
MYGTGNSGVNVFILEDRNRVLHADFCLKVKMVGVHCSGIKIDLKTTFGSAHKLHFGSTTQANALALAHQVV